MSIKKVGLLFGGRSGEHEVSIISALAIANALQAEVNLNKYQVIPTYIDQNGVWHDQDFSSQILQSGKSSISENFDLKQLWQFPSQVTEVDVWFPVLHGPNGEDGTIQGLLTLMQVPFVGSGVLGASVGMDKIAMKSAFAQAGLSQVKYLAVTREQIWSNPCIFPKLCDEIDQTLGYPCFIKPANLGSSVGIVKAKTRIELEKGLDKAASYDNRIIIEAGVNAREVECAVLGNDNPKASVVGEITFESDFYDYETKYTDGKAKLIIPASLPDAIVNQIQEMSLQAFKAINAKGLSRVDFFYVETTGEILINEINTFPGFTSLSMYPQLWANSGITFIDLVDHLINLALDN